jgi:hypothetical protein
MLVFNTYLDSSTQGQNAGVDSEDAGGDGVVSAGSGAGGVAVPGEHVCDVCEGGGGGGGAGTPSAAEHLVSNPSRKGMRISRINTRRISKRTKSNITIEIIFFFMNNKKMPKFYTGVKNGKPIEMRNFKLYMMEGKAVPAHDIATAHNDRDVGADNAIGPEIAAPKIFQEYGRKKKLITKLGEHVVFSIVETTKSGDDQGQITTFTGMRIPGEGKTVVFKKKNGKVLDEPKSVVVGSFKVMTTLVPEVSQLTENCSKSKKKSSSTKSHSKSNFIPEA